MSTFFRPDDDRISSSIEEARAANRASGMQRAVLRMRGWFIEEPKAAEHGLAASAIPAGITDINEARGRHQSSHEHAEAPEVMQGHTAGLDPQPVQTDAEGKVVDMDSHRMAQEARRQAAEAYAEMPDNGLEEGLIGQAED